MRSRWALAASVALLLFGSWLLPSRFTPDAKSEHGASGAVIGTNDIRKDLNKDRKAKGSGKQNKSGLAADEVEPIPELDKPDLPRLQ